MTSQYSNYGRTANWLKACGKVPSPNSLSVQIGCDLEEIAEYLGLLSLDSMADQETLNLVVADLEALGNTLKKGLILARIHEEDRADALDALCDREVTANGVAYLAGFDKERADELVLTSNEAKLVDGRPVILAGGKIGKPEGWRAPNLSECV